ncbi:DNA adenine methylase [Salinirubellus salinus]|uniref:site-specific DNA-methyltransferase (adenine-specific) n=1 Tax=Salinirubellus salinus TaxID=1364945 RepID=A0A9E7R8Q8_9EURY|nr:DNA adenine methylase [Salinirubellus salinus]UWM56665.1 DNA adenine methylase [Salinirubellus salinus]
MSQPNNITPISWYGGKTSHRKWILPLLPTSDTYVEPFGGSGSILLHREPSNVDVYNDLSESLTDFYRVLRDNPDNLIRALQLTPYSREEYEYALNHHDDPGLDEVEKARLFFTVCNQARAGLALSAVESQFSFVRRESYSDMAGSISRWRNHISKLDSAAERLDGVRIESRDAVAVIEEYDSPDTVFYLDPPYMAETRSTGGEYGENEMGVEDHRELLEVLSDVEGDVAISGYTSDLYEGMLSGWSRVERGTRAQAGQSGSERTEVLWCNYDVPASGDVSQSGLSSWA